MIRKLLLLAALTAALRITGLLPFKTTDVAQLKPVEALVVSVENGKVILNSGEADGQGDTWETALQDLRQGAEGTLFLETAEQLVLCAEAEALLPKIIRSEVLRPAAMVYYCEDAVPDPEQVSAYLSAHPAGLTLQQVWAAQMRRETVRLPELIQTEGGLRVNGTEDR